MTENFSVSLVPVWNFKFSRDKLDAAFGVNLNQAVFPIYPLTNVVQELSCFFRSNTSSSLMQKLLERLAVPRY